MGWVLAASARSPRTARTPKSNASARPARPDRGDGGGDGGLLALKFARFIAPLARPAPLPNGSGSAILSSRAAMPRLLGSTAATSEVGRSGPLCVMGSLTPGNARFKAFSGGFSVSGVRTRFRAADAVLGRPGPLEGMKKGRRPKPSSPDKENKSRPPFPG